jgi:chemotaxis protein MotB
MIRRRRGHVAPPHDEVPEYWITYSDLMVSLVMVFALLLFLAMARVQHEITKAERVQAQVDSVVQGMSRGVEGLPIHVDTLTGALRLDSEVLFPFASAELRPEAATAVRRLATEHIPAILARPELDTMLQEIVIEGHTDTVASYLWNLRLSQERAYAVLNEMLAAADSLPIASRLRELLVASGRSEIQPVRVNGRIDDRLSRRIEIRFRTRDAALLRDIISSVRGAVEQ